MPQDLPAERRALPRWRDKRLLLLYPAGGEAPGMTADIGPGGMAVAVPGCRLQPGDAVRCALAFAQDLVEARGRVVHTRRRRWGARVGIRFTPGQDPLFRFLARRYPTPDDPAAQPPAPPLILRDPEAFAALPPRRPRRRSVIVAGDELLHLAHVVR